MKKACCVVRLKGDLTNSFSSYRSALQVGVLPFAAPLKLVLIHKNNHGGKKWKMTSVQPLVKFVLVTARGVLADGVDHCWGITF